MLELKGYTWTFFIVLSINLLYNIDGKSEQVFLMDGATTSLGCPISFTGHPVWKLPPSAEDFVNISKNSVLRINPGPSQSISGTYQCMHPHDLKNPVQTYHLVVWKQPLMWHVDSITYRIHEVDEGEHRCAPGEHQELVDTLFGKMCHSKPMKCSFRVEARCLTDTTVVVYVTETFPRISMNKMGARCDAKCLVQHRVNSQAEEYCKAMESLYDLHKKWTGSTLGNRYTPSGLPQTCNSWHMIRPYMSCEPGFYSMMAQCLPCKPGSTSNATTNECEKCPAGTFQPHYGESKCLPCPRQIRGQPIGADSIFKCDIYGDMTKKNKKQLDDWKYQTPILSKVPEDRFLNEILNGEKPTVNLGRPKHNHGNETFRKRLKNIFKYKDTLYEDELKLDKNGNLTSSKKKLYSVPAHHVHFKMTTPLFYLVLFITPILAILIGLLCLYLLIHKRTSPAAAMKAQEEVRKQVKTKMKEAREANRRALELIGKTGGAEVHDVDPNNRRHLADLDHAGPHGKDRDFRESRRTTRRSRPSSRSRQSKSLSSLERFSSLLHMPTNDSPTPHHHSHRSSQREKSPAVPHQSPHRASQREHQSMRNHESHSPAAPHQSPHRASQRERHSIRNHELQSPAALHQSPHRASQRERQSIRNHESQSPTALHQSPHRASQRERQSMRNHESSSLQPAPSQPPVGRQDSALDFQTQHQAPPAPPMTNQPPQPQTPGLLSHPPLHHMTPAPPPMLDQEDLLSPELPVHVPHQFFDYANYTPPAPVYDNEAEWSDN